MRAVVQKVSEARVVVDGRETGAISRGLVVLVGITGGDRPEEAAWLADKVVNIRIFPDEEGKMNRSVADVGGEVLVVSQFTLYGDARKGRRPSFVRAAAGPEAEMIYDEVVREIESRGPRCATGEFGALMQVSLTNDGPVTILLDSDKAF